MKRELSLSERDVVLFAAQYDFLPASAAQYFFCDSRATEAALDDLERRGYIIVTRSYIFAGARGVAYAKRKPIEECVSPIRNYNAYAPAHRERADFALRLFRADFTVTAFDLCEKTYTFFPAQTLKRKWPYLNNNSSAAGVAFYGAAKNPTGIYDNKYLGDMRQTAERNFLRAIEVDRMINVWDDDFTSEPRGVLTDFSSSETQCGTLKALMAQSSADNTNKDITD
jgi:hypothetical protein